MKETKKLFSIAILFILALSTIILSGCTEKDGDSLSDLELAEDIRTRLKETYQPDRSLYGEGSYVNNEGKTIKFNIVDAFRDLPEMKEDMWYARYLFTNMKFESKTICNFSESYYLQPEFYANTFYRMEGDKILGGINYWKTPKFRNTEGGFGTYPADQVHVVKPGSNYKFCSYFRAGYGVEGWQVIGLKEERPEMKVEIDGTVYESKEDTEGKIKFWLDNHEVVLGPAYPRFSNNEDGSWADKINIYVEIAEDIEPGLYVIGYDVTSGTEETIGYLVDKYTDKKVTSLGMMKVGRPQLRMGLLIRE